MSAPMMSDGVDELAAILHEQGIGCNWQPVAYDMRRRPDEPVTRSVAPGASEGHYRNPLPKGYDVDGWRHDGDHLKVARAIRRGTSVVVSE